MNWALQSESKVSKQQWGLTHGSQRVCACRKYWNWGDRGLSVPRNTEWLQQGGLELKCLTISSTMTWWKWAVCHQLGWQEKTLLQGLTEHCENCVVVQRFNVPHKNRWKTVKLVAGANFNSVWECWFSLSGCYRRNKRQSNALVSSEYVIRSCSQRKLLLGSSFD